MSGSYKFIDHTADIAVEVTAGDIEELFSTSAHAFREVLIESTPYVKGKNFQIELNSNSLETLLVNYLNELNFRLSSKHKIFNKIKDMHIFKSGDVWKLKCILSEEDVEEEKIKTEIKSVTYHQMDLKKTGEGYKTIIVFDI